MSEKLTFRPAEVQAALGIGHSTFWKLVKESRLETLHIGRATVVPASSLHQFVASLSKANAA